MIIKYDFLRKQPVTVRKALLSNNLPNHIYQDERLSVNEKFRLLFGNACEEAKTVFKQRWKYKNDGTFISRNRIALDLYSSCIDLFRDVIIDPSEFESIENRIKYYEIQTNIKRLERVRDDYLVRSFINDITIENSSYMLRLCDILRNIYGMGMRTEYRAALNSFKYVWDSVSVDEMDEESRVVYCYAMAKVAKRLKDDAMLESSLSVLNDYCDEALSYIATYVKEHGVLSIGNYGYSNVFERILLAHGGENDNSHIDEDSKYEEYIRILEEVDYLSGFDVGSKARMIKRIGEYHARFYDSGVDTFKSTYSNLERYKEKDGVLVYSAWGYILIAEELFGIKIAKGLFYEFEVDNYTGPNRDEDQITEYMNYFNDVE